jgi:hypothetical protein
MQQPKRGEIWRVKLGERKQGTELLGEHPCLVISSDDYNDQNSRITIVPITSYDEHREESRSLWGVTITNRRDIDFDPKNITYHKYRNGVRYSEQILIYRKDGKLYKSIIDCGQMWTIFKFPEGHPDNELRWDRRHGELEDTPMIAVEAALQVVISGCIELNRIEESDPPYQAGDVLEMDLQSTVSDKEERSQCLVVSSTAVDAIRERIMLRRQPKNRLVPLGHCTVVPLWPPPYDYDPKKDRGVIEVTVYSKVKNRSSKKVLALCFEPYTVNWYERDTTLVGSVHRDHVEAVRHMLRDYLDLPHIGAIA